MPKLSQATRSLPRLVHAAARQQMAAMPGPPNWVIAASVVVSEALNEKKPGAYQNAARPIQKTARIASRVETFMRSPEGSLHTKMYGKSGDSDNVFGED